MNGDVRVLLVEDSEDDALLLIRQLVRAGMRPVHRRVDSAADLTRALDEEAWDVVISDYVMPGFSGLDAVRLIRQRHSQLPVVVVSGTVGEEVAVETIRAGANDYVMKDNLTRLATSVEREVREALARREHEAVDRALQYAERRFEGVLDAVPTAIVIVDERGRVVRANSHVAITFGYDPSELEGQPIEVLIPEAFRDVHVAHRRGYLENPSTRMMGMGRDLRARRKDGSEVPVEVGLATIRSADELLVVAAATDISFRLELETQLLQAQKLEAIGRLAGGVAHDFNNLLTAINGYAELVASELPADSTVREDVEEIRRAGERGATLVRQLLAFGRAQQLRPQRLATAEVVTDLEPLLRRLVTEAIELDLSADPTTPPILVDRTQLERVLVNLTVNARDAMPEGGRLTIRVAPGLTASGAGQAVLTVVDSGGGMDAATKERLFTPFFSTKPVGQGAGLGLATVHGIVSQSGGTIDVNSETGRGTSFSIRFPAAQALDAADDGVIESGPRRGGGERILLVEDEAAVRSLARLVLERFGYEVVEAATPGEAESMLADSSIGRIDALVSDVVMPGMDGRELARRVRAAQPHVRVILMSGYAPEEILRTNGQADDGSAVFLAKPFAPADLAAAVRRSLDAASLGA